MQKILFRADSSSTIGTGHIMRDLVLAEQYSAANITFAVQELSGNINHKIEETNYKIEILSSNSFNELNHLIKKLNIDMIVIDHYGLDYNFEKELKEQNPKLKIFSLDDTYEKHHCDILLNHNIYANKENYQGLVPVHSEVRCGEKYTLLREEFIQAKIGIIPTNDHTTFSIFIAMGGTDISNLNPKIIHVLTSFQDIHVHMVTTSANSNLKDLQDYVIDKSWVSLHIDVTNIAELMTQSNLAIVTPSVTMNEVWYMRIPYIAIKVAENQKHMYKFLENSSAHNVLEQFDTTQLSTTLKKILPVKVVLKPFIQLTLEEKKSVLAWRNDEGISKWMYNTETISLEEHLTYIESLNTREDRAYFLALRHNKAIGVIDFTSIDRDLGSAEIGLYALPKTKGNGKHLMGSILEHAFQTLKLKKLLANVLIENIPAIKLYKRYGFIEQHTNDKLIHMELINENR